MIKSIFNNYRDIRYNYSHKKAADTVLNSISQEKKLTKKQRQVCDDYALDVLGGKDFAPWLYVYTAINNEFKEGWIPDNYYGKFIVPKFKGLYGGISRLKPLNQKFYNNNSFPDIASFVNGVFFDENYKYINNHEIKDLLFRDGDEVIFKIDNSNQGKGIYLIKSDDFNLRDIKRLGNGLFQSKILQHEDLDLFSSSSVATLRVTSLYSDNGEVSIVATYLRLGRNKETHVQSNTHIRVSVSIDSGEYHQIGHNANWTEIYSHPDTNIKFEGRCFPSFNKAIALVKELHKKTPFARIIGWDIAVDRDGNPMIMEWNGEHNDIKYSEATQGPIFKNLGFENLWKNS